MTPQQKDLILNALRIGKSCMANEIRFDSLDPSNKKAAFNKSLHGKIRAAIKELEAMPTEEVK